MERLMGEGDMQWWKSTFRCRGGIGVDDSQPVMTLQEDLSIFSMEVIWVRDQKGNHPGKALVKMGQTKACKQKDASLMLSLAK